MSNLDQVTQTLPISRYIDLNKKGKVIFIIPEYQRPYQWGHDECDKLWDDIKNYDTSNVSYFLGTIITNVGEDNNFYLIDGQQRTITFFLLLKALLFRINEVLIRIQKKSQEKESEKVSEEDSKNVADDQDQLTDKLRQDLQYRRNQLMQILYKVDPDVDDVIIERDPDQEKDREIMSKKEAELIVNNSNNGKKYFPDFCTILESNSLEELKKEENKKPDESKLVIIMAKDRAKKNEEKFTHYYRNFKQFCNLINDPKNGVVDTDLNKFVGKLLSKCEVIEIGVRNNMDQAFTMFNSLNSDGLPLTDGDIISARLYGEDPSDDFKNSWQVLLTTLDEIPFINLDAILNQYMYYNRAQNRESDNVKSVRSYYSKDIIADPKGLCEKLIRLVNNWQKASEYPLTKILLKFNSNIRLFFGSFLMRYPTDEIEKNWDDIEDVIKCLIRVFAVLEITEASYSSSFFKHKLISENFRLSDPSIPVKDIIADFQKMINEDMSKKWNRNTILDSLKDYSSSTEKMLVYLNEYLFFQEHFAQDPDKQFEITEDCEVEHIAPSKGRGSFTTRKSYGIEDKDEYNKLVNLLGNKILLEPRINRAIGADWFSTKLVYYEKSTYPIAQHIADKKAAFFDDESKTYKWNQKNIEDATDKAAERITDFIFSF